MLNEVKCDLFIFWFARLIIKKTIPSPGEGTRLPGPTLSRGQWQLMKLLLTKCQRYSRMNRQTWILLSEIDNRLDNQGHGSARDGFFKPLVREDDFFYPRSKGSRFFYPLCGEVSCILDPGWDINYGTSLGTFHRIFFF